MIGAPGDICLGSRPHSTSLSLEWSPPSNDGGSRVESYILQVSALISSGWSQWVWFQVDDGAGGEMRDVNKGSEVSFQLDSLTPGRSYR